MNNNKQNQQIKYSNPTAKFLKSLTTVILWTIAIISFAFIVTVLIGDTDTTILKIIVFWGIFAVVIRGVAELIQLLEDLKNKDKRRYTEMNDNDNDEEKEVLKQLVKEEKEEYLNVSSFSRSGLIDQLLYEGFTEKQAEYAVYKAGY